MKRNTVRYADPSKNICQYCGKRVKKLYMYEKYIGQSALLFCSYACYYKYSMFDSGW